MLRGDLAAIERPMQSELTAQTRMKNRLDDSRNLPVEPGPAARSHAAAGSLQVDPAATGSGGLRLCLFGASPDTGNLGVSALCHSVVESVARLQPAARLTVFDEGAGVRSASHAVAGSGFRFDFCGATQTRRFWQRRSFWNIGLSHRLGGLGNPAVARLRSADAVLDISGGDSFTDLYGPARFASVVASKRLALQHGRPLVLLPQTYGPFQSSESRAIARDIVRRAAMAWARDARSFDVLRELLAGDFDPARHRSGVDVAFALEPRRPARPLPELLASWLVGESGRREVPVIGFNVSGLIWHDPAAARDRYGFKADYRACVLGFLRRALRQSEARIVLVPHVLTPPGHYESDPAANDAVVAALRVDDDQSVRRAAAERLAVVPPLYHDPGEMKWIISRLDWFCGTRMHACIAGLSSGVPTAAIAYSVKTLGVFEAVGQGDRVADPRAIDLDAVVDQLWCGWSDRSDIHRSLIERAEALGDLALQPFGTLVGRAAPAAVMRAEAVSA